MRSENWAAIKTDGSLWAWGGNDEGQLGLNNTTRYSSPTQLTTRTLQDYGAIGGNQFAWKY